jgi:uncharacterized membrane protein YdjX (TVP38/TMEM64 family)
MRLLRPLSDFLLVHHRAIAGVCACFLDLDRLDTRLAKQGSHYALMIRAAPIAPFAITSYGLAPTPITFGEYLGTTLTALPFLFVFVYFGSIGRLVIGAEGAAA